MWSAPAPTPRAPTSPSSWSCWSATPTGARPPTRCATPGSTGSRSGTAEHRVDPAGDRPRGGRPVAGQPPAPDAGGRAPGRPRAVPAAVGQHHREPAVPGPRDQPGGRGDRRRPGPPGGQLRHRQGGLPRRHRRPVRPHRRAGLHHPGPGLARLPPLRPVPDPERAGRPGQGQSPAGSGGLPPRAHPELCHLRQRQVRGHRQANQGFLARAGIRLKIHTFKGFKLYDESLGIPSKRLEHQLGQSFWLPDYLGDNARQSIVLHTTAASTQR
jgi:hypothetical protein